MKDTKLAYFAGIIDSEGGVTITYFPSRKNHRIRMYVVNTKKDLMDWLKTNIGGYVYEVKRTSHKNPKWKTKYEWHFLPSRDSVNILKDVLPYLVIKKQQVEICIKFISTFQELGKNCRLSPEQFNLRESLRQELKKLNSRGIGCND